MENNFTFEQMVALITWLEEMRYAGYNINDIIADLTDHSTTKELPAPDQDLSDVS